MRQDKLISEVKMHLSSIEDILSTLEKSQNKDKSGIDINEIEQFARQAPFNNHFIQKYDRGIIIEYCTLLASFVRYCDDTVKRIKQYYFTARLLYSAVDDYKLTDIITNAELIEYADFKNIGEVLDNRRVLFIFDGLLMISMDGQQEERQMEYLLEVAAFANIHKKDLINICKVCTCILEGKKEELYEYAGAFHIVEASYYLEKPIIYPIVTTLEDINNQEEAEVLIVGAYIKNIMVQLSRQKSEIFIMN